MWLRGYIETGGVGRVNKQRKRQEEEEEGKRKKKERGREEERQTGRNCEGKR